MQRLAWLGYTTGAELAFWRGLWLLKDKSFFYDFLRREEDAAANYCRWLPRLHAFAAECRRNAPVPALESLAPVEREQHRILLAKMQDFVASEDGRRMLERKPYRAAILSTTRVGLTAAQQVFGHTGAVLLQEEERERWFSEVCPVDHEALWWYGLAWWTLQEFPWWLRRDALSREEAEALRRHYPMVEGTSYWVVISGSQSAPLAGGAAHELWRWDGRRAEFIDVICVDTY